MRDDTGRTLDKAQLRKRLFLDRWFLTVEVKILIVTDSSSGGFGTVEGFHLGHILQILADDPWSHISFNVTKAHRQETAEAGVIDNFRFNQHDLNQYSQVWLFGINATGVDPLTPVELKALAQFMDQGGGVFATGDHEDLGQPMAAEVPRVRSMRRWHWPNPGPDGEPVAPDVSGSERHDTVVELAAGGSQLDKLPQPILPTWYARRSGGGFITRVHSFPHPLLCGPDGPIEYLPDHMHEGHCEVPSDLSKSFTFDGYMTVEYPSDGAGHQEPPKVVAKATTRNTDNSEFGVIAAYDGHRVGIGRVVVDATWHHWFNINLDGFLDATDPVNPGFDPAIVPKWKAIKAYFRNVAVWLAQPDLQGRIRNGGLLVSLGYYDIQIAHRQLEQVRDPLPYYWQLGVFARDALGRLASRFQTTRFVIDILFELDLPLRIDPWWRDGPVPPPDPPPWLDLVDLENVAMGGAVHALLERLGGEKNAQRLLDEAGADVAALARRGAAQATAELFGRFGSVGGEAEKLAKVVTRQR